MITLGIIGIVAALTMPALVANYQKKVLETRIKKFYSVMAQAVSMKQSDDGEITGINAYDNAVAMEEYFNANYAPYIKTMGNKQLAKGYLVGFSDGSGAYFRKYSGTESLYFCVDYKLCENIDENLNYQKVANGKSTFRFYLNGAVPTASWNGTREQLVANCNRASTQYCATLLWYDNWEVKEDYPW